MPITGDCPNCSTVVGAAATVLCDGCKSLIHVSCTDISPDFAARITRAKSKTVKVYCSPCNASDDKVLKLANMLDGFKAYMDSKFAALEAMVKDKEASASPSVELVVAEAMERIKRSNNVIIHNLPESLSANSSDSQQTTDFEKVCELTKHIQGDQSIVPASVRRVGKGGNGKPRIIIARFNTPEAAKKILKNKKKLKQAHNDFSSVSITDDRTPAQVEYLDKLRSELKHRIDSGEKDLTIRYDKGVPSIVKVNQKNQA